MADSDEAIGCFLFGDGETGLGGRWRNGAALGGAALLEADCRELARILARTTLTDLVGKNLQIIRVPIGTELSRKPERIPVRMSPSPQE